MFMKIRHHVHSFIAIHYAVFKQLIGEISREKQAVQGSLEDAFMIQKAS
jgi:hypothetical protein